MDNLDYIYLFCSYDVYPKLLCLSDYHSFLGIGKSTDFVDLSQENHFYVYSRSFYQNEISSLWDPFPPNHFYLPHLVFLDGQEYHYSDQIIPKKNLSFNAICIETPLTHDISFLEWDRLINCAKHSHLNKVVLARKSTFFLTQEVDPLFFLQNLSKQAGSLFAYQIDPTTVFFGLTPEHLFVRSGQTLFTEAVAGTRQRGLNPIQDAFFEQELLHSHKDHDEFLFVSDYLQEQLKPFSFSINQSPIKIKKCPHVQHLHQTFHAQTNSCYNDIAMINILHPTPAMCGVPKEDSMKWIRQHETFDRGLYASPLGWVSKNHAEILVSIRSCLMKRRDLFLFAGLGVVKNSDSALEWQELNHKLRWIEDVFHQQNSQTHSLVV